MKSPSSTPTASGVGRLGSGIRISRFSTDAEDNVWCSVASSLAPAQPASTTATASTIRRSAGVLR
ncbi:hypothetical protein [Streptomyces sp. NPDC058751]|uniref:hypothetical protein n=1 Tax=Streptomyces sp. NPDC058751 TaxID=3346623 RepID=UPI00369E8B5B